jgi:hypothetical protein
MEQGSCPWDTLYSRTGSVSRRGFCKGLQPLTRRVAWTSGRWMFPDGSLVHWDEVENTSKQIQRLALYLVGVLKRREFSQVKRSVKR